MFPIPHQDLFPFLCDTECTLMKAELIDGKIRDLVEKPEIHGDPMSSAHLA
jgi:hypothetical protein